MVKVGIVGLPNVGKSTLFNALLKKQLAYVANFPFATIEPNVGIVPVPDPRLNQLQAVVSSQSAVVLPIVPATVEFIDIAGIIAGAHKGEGLGNKFLSHIREVDAIAHVVRVFSDNDIIRTGTSPKEDLEIIETELALADLETLSKQTEPKLNASKEQLIRWGAVVKLKGFLSRGESARSHLAEFSEDEREQIQQLSLLTYKPVLVVLNVDEEQLEQGDALITKFIAETSVQGVPLNRGQVVVISAKVEAELATLSEDEQKDYLKDLGVEQSGLERLAQIAFKTLGLITFLTAGEKEVRAWTIKKGFTALEASGVIHTDFMNKFIKAEIVKYEDFISLGGWKRSREQGKARLEGKTYIVQDGDVIEFKIGA